MSMGMRLPLTIPDTLQTQLHEFRRRLWTIKLTEAACGAACGLFAAFLLTYAIDRIWNTPAVVRLAMFILAVGGCALVPWAMHRWVWRQRKLEQLARLLSHKHPSIGDQLLGILELAHDETEQARSRTLCAAAIQHVAEQARQRNFQDAVPAPRHREWMSLAAVMLVATLLLMAIYPAASLNAWQRMLMPWSSISRYTFTVPQSLPDRLVLPHGEPCPFVVSLAEMSRSQPAQGQVQIGAQPAVSASLRDGRYSFELPPQIDSSRMTLSLGDFSHGMVIEPMLRPELTSLTAAITLPEYLGRPGSTHKQVHSGTLTLVEGTTVELTATIGRNIQSAAFNGDAVSPQGEQIVAPPVEVINSTKAVFEWKDEFGLSGREPFSLSVTARPDEAPTLICEDLPRLKVVLESETLAFRVTAQDDFGIKQVGIEWRGLDESAVQDRAQGERLLAAGGPEQENLAFAGTFSASNLGISAQPIALRVFAVDYLPGRERTYSPTYLLHVLTAEQHAAWITDQLSKWHRQSLEVRDRELALYETNKQLRELTEEELDHPETRKRLATQSAAERTNGRRLTALVGSGEDLVKQAARNPEMGVGHLEKWAEMLQILKDISTNRMPSVADLLKDAAQTQAQASAANPSSPKGPTAGQNRNTKTSAGGENQAKPEPPKPAVPTVTDVESSQQPSNKDQPPAPPENKKPGNPSLRLPTTMVAGTGKSKPKPQTPQAQKLDEAVKQQQDLLAEFDKIVDELNRVLANLEGSTLVKRLKAQARLQNQIALKIGEQAPKAFGVTKGSLQESEKKVLGDLVKEEEKSGRDVSYIMDDMQAFFERRRFAKFQSVLEEMRKEDVLGSLRNLADDLPKENGISMAMAEFWSDTLDRWAEDLVDPACKGCCPGCKSKGSLPPSIVLEVLQILEGEINLREETRVTEQSKAAIAAQEHGQQAAKLSQTQDELRDRIDKVEERIRELPDAEEDFGKEIALMQQVSQVMREATQILAQPQTGNPAIAAETEAIELLLKSKRFNPKGGGGGGSSPGGGGGGDTVDSALALLGKGTNEKEVREDRGISQASGDSGEKLPEEFRAGLDEYFNRLERPVAND